MRELKEAGESKIGKVLRGYNMLIYIYMCVDCSCILINSNFLVAYKNETLFNHK